MSIISKEAELTRKAINASYDAKSTGSGYYKEKARMAALELELYKTRKQQDDRNNSRNYNKGWGRDDW